MQTLYKELSSYFKYFADFHVETEQEIKVLDRIFKKHKARSVLDVACGVGRHSIALAKLGYKITGIDYSPYQISEAKKWAQKEKIRVNFLKLNANKFKFLNRFDAAICMWSTLGEEPMQYEKVIKNVFDSLKKNGIFFIDNRSWADIPKSREGIIRNKFIDRKKDLELTHIMHDRYTDNFRVRDIIYTINGKKYKDLAITRIIRPKEWIEEFKKAGFKKCRILKSQNKKRLSVFIVAEK